MFSGGDQYAFLHQAGGVAHPGHIPGLSLDGESFEIGAPEQDAGVGRGGAKTQVNLDARVKSDPRDGGGRCNSLLVGQISPPERGLSALVWPVAATSFIPIFISKLFGFL
jgi:hypothetical protein